MAVTGQIVIIVIVVVMFYAYSFLQDLYIMFVWRVYSLNYFKKGTKEED